MNIKIVCNDNSKIQARIIKHKLVENGFKIVQENPDFVFIIGGDGTFLRALREINYSRYPVYVCINSGTLGYLQDISCAQVDRLITFLKKNTTKLNDKNINKMALAKIKYFYADGSVKIDNAINELQLSGKKYHKMQFYLSDCIEFKQKVVSSGIILSTPYGSTAYNKSLGGPVFCQGVNAICSTLIAPIQNSKTEDYILNSLIGNKFSIEILSDTNDIDVIIDGQDIQIDLKDICRIEVEIDEDYIYKLNMDNKSYIRNLLEKMLKSNS